MVKGINIAARSAARELLVQALYQWQMNESGQEELLEQFRLDKDYSKVDSEYFESNLLAILNESAELDESLLPVLDRKLELLDPVAHAILWLSAFEFKHKIEIPYRVVMNEAIKLAKKFGPTDSHKYVNAILDKLAVNLRAIEVEHNKNTSNKTNKKPV